MTEGEWSGSWEALREADTPEAYRRRCIQVEVQAQAPGLYSFEVGSGCSSDIDCALPSTLDDALLELATCDTA